MGTKYIGTRCELYKIMRYCCNWLWKDVSSRVSCVNEKKKVQDGRIHPLYIIRHVGGCSLSLLLSRLCYTKSRNDPPYARRRSLPNGVRQDVGSRCFAKVRTCELSYVQDLLTPAVGDGERSAFYMYYVSSSVVYEPAVRPSYSNPHWAMSLPGSACRDRALVPARKVHGLSTKD